LQLPAVGDHGVLFALAVVAILCSGAFVVLHREEGLLTSSPTGASFHLVEFDDLEFRRT